MISALLVLSLASANSPQDKNAWGETPEYIHFDSKWGVKDTGLEIALAGVSLYDVMSTRYCLAHNTCREGNPDVHSQTPSALVLYSEFGLLVGAHALIAYFLPQPWRFIWQAVALTGETINVGSQFSIGAKIQF